jgi:hypothetical protein
VTELPPVALIDWPRTYRIISSKYPPIDLFEDIADPADWELLASAEAKTNPRLHENIGNLALVPVNRRVSGPNASWVMAPFVHASAYRPGRFHDGNVGAYYAGESFEVALFETIFHFGSFLRATDEPATTSTFRELVGAVRAELHDLRSPEYEICRNPDSYADSHRLAATLRANGSDGVVYQSVRYPEGNCIAAFYPDVVRPPVQGRHLTYHWDGERVDYVKDLASGDVFRVVE